jgi:hypothetical protein
MGSASQEKESINKENVKNQLDLPTILLAGHPQTNLFRHRYFPAAMTV